MLLLLLLFSSVVAVVFVSVNYVFTISVVEIFFIVNFLMSSELLIFFHFCGCCCYHLFCCCEVFSSGFSVFFFQFCKLFNGSFEWLQVFFINGREVFR